MDKAILLKNFSRFASLYDKYADVQKVPALKLLDGLKKRKISSILEIGCGSGNYTLLLREKFGSAELKAVDISKEMVVIAGEKLKNKGVEFIVQDAENFNLSSRFDLITSNACFQWFDDMEKALIKYKQWLNQGGIISFSVFGPETFCELSAALKDVARNASIQAGDFISIATIKRILADNFKEIKIEEIRREETFSHLKSLLDKIRYSGIRGRGVQEKIFFGRDFLNKLERAYLERFKKIIATYQIFVCWGAR